MALETTEPAAEVLEAAIAVPGGLSGDSRQRHSTIMPLSSPQDDRREILGRHATKQMAIGSQPTLEMPLQQRLANSDGRQALRPSVTMA